MTARRGLRAEHADTDVVLIGGMSQLRALAAAGLRPLVVRRSASSDIRHSRHFRDAGLLLSDLRRNEGACVDALLSLSRSLPSPPVLFYGDDEVLSFVARHQERLREGYRFQMPESPLVMACLDKVLFARLADVRGLPRPRQIVATTDLDASTIQRVIGFPCALKPALRDGWFESDTLKAIGGKPQKILRADTLDECRAALGGIRLHTDRFIVQEFIPGDEDQVYSFHAYVPGRPLPRAAYVGRKIRTYPSMGGQSTYVRLVRNDDVMRLGWQTVDKLGLSGIMKIDFKRDVARDRYYVLEVNLRSSLWTHLGARCGINLAELAYLDQCGLSYEPVSDYRTDVRWLHVPRDVHAVLGEYHPRGDLTIAKWLRGYLRPKVYASFAWDDPLPSVLRFVSRLRGLVARMVTRRAVLQESTQPAA